MFDYDEALFSDMYKDAHGFRPRGHEFYSATPERKQEIWDHTFADLVASAEAERQASLAQQKDFELTVARCMEYGLSRVEAIRELVQQEAPDHPLERDFGYAMWCGWPSLDNDFSRMYAAEIGVSTRF